MSFDHFSSKNERGTGLKFNSHASTERAESTRNRSKNKYFHDRASFSRRSISLPSHDSTVPPLAESGCSGALAPAANVGDGSPRNAAVFSAPMATALTTAAD